VSAQENRVIPSRVDGEGPRNRKLSRLEVSVTQFPAERSLIVCAIRDDRKRGGALR